MVLSGQRWCDSVAASPHRVGPEWLYETPLRLYFHHRRVHGVVYDLDLPFLLFPLVNGVSDLSALADNAR